MTCVDELPDDHQRLLFYFVFTFTVQSANQILVSDLPYCVIARIYSAELGRSNWQMPLFNTSRGLK